MIAFLKGIVEEIREDRVLLDVNGVGYQAFLSGRDLAEMPSPGSRILLYTYLSVREDAMTLFGFLSEDDLSVYRLLLGVNGVGPKAALGILSVLSGSEIRYAVLADDAKTIGRAPGIGPKTAKKVILELKDKFDLADVVEDRLESGAAEAGAGAGKAGDARNDAVQALVALGYSGTDALRAVRAIQGTEDMDTETILKNALKKLL